jgi:hypothetical protein
LEVNSEKTKYMLMSRKKAGQKHGIKIATKFEECLLPFGPESLVFPPLV